jgi:3-oxoadipate enol-lactonase
VSAAVELGYRVDGPPEAPEVVLLHAIGTSAAMWAPQRPELALDHRVISVDLRGHGTSPVPDGPYAMGELAGDVVRLLDRLGVARASVCGLSLGGMVALVLARQAPDRVDRLVAAAVVPVPASPTAWLERAALVLDGGTQSIRALVLERWGYASRAPDIGRAVLEMLAGTQPQGYAGCCAAIASMDLRPLLPLIAAPTLLLAGDADPAAPASVAEEMARAMPDARVEVIAGAAHLINVEAPEATTRAIAAHLRR